VAALLVLFFVALAIRNGVARSEGAARSGAILVAASLVAFAVQDLASFTIVALGSLAAAVLGWLASAGGGASERRETSARSRRAAGRPWAVAVAGAPILALFVLLVVLPVRAQMAEKVAIRARDGSVERAAALTRAAVLAPWDARYQSLLGASLLAQAATEPDGGRDLLRRAARAERSAIALEPQDSYYGSNLGRVLAAQALLHPPDATAEDARRAFARAMAGDPTNAEIMDQASHAMIQLGRMEEARLVARRAATAYPELAQPMAVFGYIAILDRRWADAADTLELATRRQWWGEEFARATTWSNLSAAYLALNRNEDALRAAEEAVRLAPSDADARGNRDLAKERLGRKSP
jgi:Flp pilus assembly protein TadD